MRRSPEIPFVAPPCRPWVIVNMAMSADAKIASANREVTRIGSDRDLDGLYALRATADAILCGARTIEESRATLGNGDDRHRRSRLRRGLTEHPLRVLATGSGSLLPGAEIWAHRFSPILVLTTRRATPLRRAVLRKLADHVWISTGNEVNFRIVLERLHREFAVRRLVVEGGGELNDALFRTGLVDEVHLTLCPLILGGRAAPTIADGRGVTRLAQASRFTLVRSRRVEGELHAVFQRAPDCPAADSPATRPVRHSRMAA